MKRTDRATCGYFLRAGCCLNQGLHYGPPRYPRQIIMLPVGPEPGEEPGSTFFVHILN